MHVPREPVRTLTFDATEPRAVFARDALVSAARAIRERSRREGNGVPTKRTRPFFQPSLLNLASDLQRQSLKLLEPIISQIYQKMKSLRPVLQ